MATKKASTPKGIHHKLSILSKEMGFLSFDKKNTGQGYKYASAAGVIRKLQTLCVEHGVTRRCIEREFQMVTGEGNKSNLVATTATWEWRDIETGEFVHTQSVGMGKDSGDKAMMKSATADNKYDIAHTLCLAWGAEDPEDDSKESRQKAKTVSAVDTAELHAAIRNASTLPKLESLKSAVLKLKGPSLDQTKAIFKKRRAELSA